MGLGKPGPFLYPANILGPSLEMPISEMSETKRERKIEPDVEHEVVLPVLVLKSGVDLKKQKHCHGAVVALS